MRMYTTVCFRTWPRHWVTYYQELRPPYRRCERAHVIRIATFGLVLVPRWTTRALSEDDALMYGLGARVIPREEDLDAWAEDPDHVSKRRHQDV